MSDSAERAATRESLDRAMIRFAGDPGGGIQAHRVHTAVAPEPTHGIAAPNRPRPTPRRRGRAARLAAAIAAGALALSGCLGPQAQRSYDLLNAERAQARLATLAEHGQLTDKAEGWAEHMARTGVLEHSNLAQGAPRGWRALGQNVGMGRHVDEVHRFLMGSRGHRANIMGNWTHVGVGVATGPDGRVWLAQVFMR